jgi:hypothetical protein
MLVQDALKVGGSGPETELLNIWQTGPDPPTGVKCTKMVSIVFVVQFWRILKSTVVPS